LIGDLRIKFDFFLKDSAISYNPFSEREWVRAKRLCQYRLGQRYFGGETEKNNYTGMRRSSRGIAKGSKWMLATGT